MFQLPKSWDINKRISELKKESFLSWADKQPSNLSRYRSIQSKNDNVIRVLSFPEVSPSGKQDIINEFDYFKSIEYFGSLAIVI